MLTGTVAWVMPLCLLDAEPGDERERIQRLTITSYPEPNVLAYVVSYLHGNGLPTCPRPTSTPWGQPRLSWMRSLKRRGVNRLGKTGILGQRLTDSHGAVR